ncbi:MAG: TIR domain-containing protein [Candidatus Hydrogenedentes bacterium]|nr:TIR domain-containing protein [Candidatus Hydrogenedentota bacterium]
MSQVHIFVSYSHDDARWFAEDKLMPRLIKSLEIIGAEVWYDHRRLGGGDPWKQEIVDAIKKAHIAILLVSRNFLNSDFIREIEIPRIERRFDQGELIVVPILVGHCNWQNVRMLSRPQMVPGKPTPLISYLDSPAEWDRVQEEIFSAIERQVDRVRDKYHMQAPVRHDSTFDASATITRLSGALPKIPVVNPPDDTRRENRDAPRREPERRESTRRVPAELDSHHRPVKAAAPKQTASFLKTGLMFATAMFLAAAATAGLLLYGPFSGNGEEPKETVQASEVVPVSAPATPPGAQPIAPATPAPLPPGNVSGPGVPMPASTPGTTPAPPVQVVPNPAPPVPASVTVTTPAVTPEPTPAPMPQSNTTPPAAQPSPVPKVVAKPAPVKKPVQQSVPSPVQPAPAPKPKKTEDILKDAAVDILVEKLKR